MYEKVIGLNSVAFIYLPLAGIHISNPCSIEQRRMLQFEYNYPFSFTQEFEFPCKVICDILRNAYWTLKKSLEDQLDQQQQ